jgi:KaiC/GvpD/RAD55 family RecA-like ATPase
MTARTKKPVKNTAKKPVRKSGSGSRGKSGKVSGKVSIKVTRTGSGMKPAGKKTARHEKPVPVQGVRNAGKAAPFDMAKVKAEIDAQLKGGKIKEEHAQILEQRAPAYHALKNLIDRKRKPAKSSESVVTGVPGFDELFEHGVPKGSAVILAGGAGSGKTIFCLQTLAYQSSQGKKCFYMSFEESESRLLKHMKELGWDVTEAIKARNVILKRYSPFEITRSVDAMLAKEKGELLIDLEPVLIPKDFTPDMIFLDSLTAVASAFTGKEDSYRIYIEQLFRFFEKLGCTSFLITETKQIPDIFSTTGVEEFLADGVIVFYNVRKGGIRENAVEVLKMRGEHHRKKLVALQITDKGIVVYPEQELFSNIE